MGNIHDVSGGNLLSGALGNRLGDFLNLGTGDQEGNVEHVVTESLDGEVSFVPYLIEVQMHVRSMR